MDAGTIGVFIPILAIGLGFFGVWTSHKQKLAKLEMQARTHKADDRQAARIEELEDRMRIMERIVTDRGFDVANQIEALRSERRIDETLKNREVEGSN